MQAPKCSGCVQPMIEVGPIGRDVQVEDGDWVGVRSLLLWQCPECKEITLK